MSISYDRMSENLTTCASPFFNSMNPFTRSSSLMVLNRAFISFILLKGTEIIFPAIFAMLLTFSTVFSPLATCATVLTACSANSTVSFVSSTTRPSGLRMIALSNDALYPSSLTVSLLQNESQPTHARTFLASPIPLFRISADTVNDCLFVSPFVDNAGFIGSTSIAVISTPSGKLMLDTVRTFFSCCRAKYSCGFVASSQTSSNAERNESQTNRIGARMLSMMSAYTARYGPSASQPNSNISIDSWKTKRKPPDW